MHRARNLFGLAVEALIDTGDTHIRHRHRNSAGGYFSDGPDTNDGLLGLQLISP